MRRRKQYGGQEQTIEQLQSQVAQLRSEADQKKAEAEKASKNFEDASETLRSLTAEKARINENASIKIQASTNANALTKRMEESVKTAELAKQTANAEYALAEKTKEELKMKVNATQKQLNDLTLAEADSKAKMNAAQVEVAKSKSTVNSLQTEINTAERTVKTKSSAMRNIETREAKTFDPSLLDGLRGWFDASQLSGGDQSAITAWNSSPTINTIASPPRFTGTATVRLWNTMKILSVSPAQSLTLTPAVQFSEFTLFLVCRHSGTNRNAIFQGSTASNTFFGYFTGKKNFFSIGNSHNNATALPADTNWDILSFSRDSSRKAVFSSNGKQIIEFPNTTAGFDGLSVNTGTQKSDAEFAEVIVFGKALTADEIQKVEGLLARKWNLIDTLNNEHTYKYKYPDILGVLSGGRKKRRMRKLKRKTKKVRKARRRSTYRR